MATAIFPGSFDPFTLGHEEVVRRGLLIFDTIRIGIGVNSQKSTMFTAEQRLEMIRGVFAGEPRVIVETFEGLTVAYARLHHAQAMLRGLRNGVDLEYEKPIALINRELQPEIETVFILPSGAHAHISSTLVREVIRYGGDISRLVPPAVAKKAGK